MKKIITICLVALLALTFCACGNKEETIYNGVGFNTALEEVKEIYEGREPQENSQLRKYKYSEEHFFGIGGDVLYGVGEENIINAISFLAYPEFANEEGFNTVIAELAKQFGETIVAPEKYEAETTIVYKAGQTTPMKIQIDYSGGEKLYIHIVKDNVE